MNRVAWLATAARTDVAVWLGPVAAQEVGHLMMRTPAHARRGLESADLRSFTLQEIHDVHMTDIPFGTTDWSSVPAVRWEGTSGLAYWRTVQCGGIRVRMVEYTAGYVANHWCTKGHILLCLEGELHTELEDGRAFVLTPGMSYQVADDTQPHRTSTRVGAKLFIVD